MSEYNSLEQIRLQKIIDLRAAGVEPYPTRAARTHTAAKAISEFETAEAAANGGPIEEIKVTLTGRIRAARAMGKLTFAHIEDGTGKIQLFLRINELGQEQISFFDKMFDIGDFVQASGLMMRSRTGEITLHVHEFSMLSKAVSPLPADKDVKQEDGSVIRYSALEGAELRARQRYSD
ncbi:MAG: OB-fold nucleic acid binding domain-containing protein, partial [Chloroflexota bacterium]